MIDQVSPAQWKDWMAQQADQGPALLLDVREDWELQTASVKPDGFELLHIPMGQLVQRLSELDIELLGPKDLDLTAFQHSVRDVQRDVLQTLPPEVVRPFFGMNEP